MEVMSDTDISFEEFKELCEEAGITSDNLGQLEADFRSGKALADVTDALIADYETKHERMSENEHIDAIDVAFCSLAESDDMPTAKVQAIKLAVQALRYLAECCHDEGQN
jgi:hypothetical protein